MKGAKRLIGLLAIIAALSLLVFAFLPKPVPVEVAYVVRGPFQKSVDEDGKTRVRDRYVVSAPLAGHLLRIQLKAGDPIERGGVLAVMVPAPPSLLDVRTETELQERLGAAEAERLRAESAVARAKAALDQAETDLGRTRQLAKKGVLAQAQLEQEELTVTLRTRELEAAGFENHVAEHQVELARAALLRARRGTDVKAAGERLKILSPVPGRVLRILQESEGVVALGTPLLEIADPSDLEVVVDVLTTDAIQVQPGMPVQIERYGGGFPLAGRVRLIEPSAFTKISALGVEEQRVNVVVDIISPFDQWKAVGDGYRVEARIIVFSAGDVIQVPAGALFRDGDRWAVFVMSDDRARKRVVQIGPRSGSEALVEKGVEPGEKVIVYPSDAVKDGVRVEPR